MGAGEAMAFTSGIQNRSHLRRHLSHALCNTLLVRTFTLGTRHGINLKFEEAQNDFGLKGLEPVVSSCGVEAKSTLNQIKIRYGQCNRLNTELPEPVLT